MGYDIEDSWPSNWCEGYTSYCSYHPTVQQHCAFTCAVNLAGIDCPVDQYDQCARSWKDHCGKSVCDGTPEVCNSQYPNYDHGNKGSLCTTCWGMKVRSAATSWEGVEPPADILCPRTCSQEQTAKRAGRAALLLSSKDSAKHQKNNRKKSAGAGAL